MKEQMSTTGYSHEDEYFYKLNKELIEKRRNELAATKAAQEQAQKKKEHWMRCPKCGSDMKEIDMSGIMIDRCAQCQGVYFDAGELETLLAAKEPSSFFQRLKKKML